MPLSKERIGALIFLLLSVVYGYYSGQIVLYPGDELEPMTARTVPLVLSGLGIALSIALFATGGRAVNVKIEPQSRHWLPVILLLLLTLLYGLTLDWLGFALATILFLIGGFRILGERRWPVLLSIAIPFVLVFWFGLTQLLDIYLAPGRLFSDLF